MNYIIKNYKNLSHDKNNMKFFQRKNNDRKALTTTFGKFITDVLIFAATITFI